MYLFYFCLEFGPSGCTTSESFFSKLSLQRSSDGLLSESFQVCSNLGISDSQQFACISVFLVLTGLNRITQDWFKLYTDGDVCGNPDIAGGGDIISNWQVVWQAF